MECTFQYVIDFAMSKKEDILNTTLKLVIEKGIHNTPMSLIAEEAGVGMGTIYNYFASKEVLINALYLKLKEDEAEYMLKNSKSAMTVRQSFFFFLDKYFELFYSSSYRIPFSGTILFLPFD